MIIRWDKIKDYFFKPCPTLFDLCVCLAAAGVGFVRSGLRGWYLEFLAIFIVIVGFNYKQKRHFKGGSLSILCILGLISLSVHSYYVGPGSATFKYLNFYLMHEGFAYIFFGCLLFYIVATKATNLRLLVFTLPIAMIPWVRKMLWCGQMTPLLAVGVGILAYLLYKRRFKWAIFVALIGLDIAVWNRTWLLMKFECRPLIWRDLWELVKHPPFTGSYLIERFRDSPFTFCVGSGFNKLFVPANMLKVYSYGGTWLYRHNDPLSLMAYIGFFAIVPLCMFVKDMFTRFMGTWFIAPAIAFCLLCFIQVTFIYPDRVVIILLSLAWFYIESKKGDL